MEPERVIIKVLREYNSVLIDNLNTDPITDYLWSNQIINDRERVIIKSGRHHIEKNGQLLDTLMKK